MAHRTHQGQLTSSRYCSMAGSVLSTWHTLWITLEEEEMRQSNLCRHQNPGTEPAFWLISIPLHCFSDAALAFGVEGSSSRQTQWLRWALSALKVEKPQVVFLSEKESSQDPCRIDTKGGWCGQGPRRARAGWRLYRGHIASACSIQIGLQGRC